MRERGTWLLVGALAFAPAAWAQTRDPAAAEALFLAGRDAAERGDWATACPKFAESDRLDPAAGTRINLADCEEHLHQPAAAWQHWREALELLTTDDPRVPSVTARAKSIEGKVPRLTLKLGKTVPPGSQVTRDGIEIGIASYDVPLPVEPGEHVIVVESPEHKPRETHVTLTPGQRSEVVLEPGELIEAPKVIAPPPPPPPPPPPASHLGRTVGWVSIAAGGAVAILGVTMGLLAIDRMNAVDQDCYAGICTPAGGDAASAGRAFAATSTVSFIVAPVALGVGALLVFLAPRSHTARKVGLLLLEGTF